MEREMITPKGGRITPNLKLCRVMKEIELDDWFFSLPAFWQMDITGIHYDLENAIDETYEAFDNEVAEWWDGLMYEEKLYIYERETR